MSKRLLRSSLVFATLLLLGLVAAQMTPHTQAAPALVKTASANILVNAKRMTLYIFSIDKKNKSMCSGNCAKYWPPVTVPKGTSVPATMPGIMGKFGAATRADGSRQLTYDGAPLYTFLNDKKPGDMNGQGFGSVWWVVAAPGKAAPSS
jgi:predicted lipoprotein with Yx(FWY)xxD motif